MEQVEYIADKSGFRPVGAVGVPEWLMRANEAVRAEARAEGSLIDVRSAIH